MPYFTDYADEDEKKKELDPNSVQLASAGEIAGPGGSQQGGLKPTQEVNSGSGYQNLDKYISANKSNSFGQQFIGKAGEGVQKAYDSKNAASDQFKNQVTQANSLPTEDQIQGAIADPSQSSPDQYKGWREDPYKGPTNLADNQDVWNKYWSGINQAKAPTEQLGSESGRHTLLDSYFGRPGYNHGEKTLDNLLVGKSDIGKQTRELNQKVSGLKSSGLQGENDLGNFASQRAGQVNQSAKGARDAVGGALNQEYENVDKSVAAQNQQRQGEQEAIKGAFASGNLSPSQLESLGLNGNESPYDLDLNQYLTPGAEIGKNHVLGDSDRSRIQALSDLAGVTNTYTGIPKDRGKDYSFDTGRFNQDAQGKASQYQGEIKAATKDLQPHMPNASPDEMYRFMQKWQSGGATDAFGRSVPANNDYQAQINQYQAAENKYKPNRKVKA